jgi:hypothetical protein
MTLQTVGRIGDVGEPVTCGDGGGVGGLVGGNVGGLVGGNVGGFVGGNVGALVGGNVGNGVGDLTGANVGGLVGVTGTSMVYEDVALHKLPGDGGVLVGGVV